MIDFPLYDPNYFDEYCAPYHWCFKSYNETTCKADSAWGLTDEEARWIYVWAWAAPIYFAIVLLAVVIMPELMCLYIVNDMNVCTFGLEIFSTTSNSVVDNGLENLGNSK